MAERPLKKPLHKRWTLWLLVLLALYTLLGFLVLPWWLERALPAQFEERMGWTASVAQVSANPFAVSVSVRDLAASDAGGEPVLSFERLHLDLGFLQLLRGVVALETIDLDQPFVRVDLLEDYGINLLRDWRAHNPPAKDEAAANPADDQGDPASLYFGRISLNQGEVLLRDFSKAEEARFEIRSLDLVLNDLATFPTENGSGYRFDAVLGEQSLNWEGQLEIAPFRSDGRLRIENLAASTIGHFAAPYLPYQLREGRLTVESDYRISTADGLALETSEGRIQVQDLAMATAAEVEAPDLALASLAVDGVSFSLGQRQLEVGEVSLQGLDALVARAADGSLNLTRPFDAGQEEDAAAQGNGEAAGNGDAGEPFRWSVARATLDQSRVSWQDSVPEGGASLELTDLDFTVEGLSHELGEPVTYDASLAVADGSASAQGQLTLSPFTLEAGVSAQGLALAAAQGYLAQLAQVDVKGGRLNLDGDLDLDGQTDPLTGTLSGRGEVVELALSLAGQEDRLLGWQAVRLEPIEYNLAPARLEIGTIRVMAPVATVERSPDGGLNLARALATGESGDSGESGQEAAGDDGDGFIFRVGEVVLEEGVVAYTDRSLERPFSVRLHQLAGSMTGLSNVTPQEGQVRLTGQVAEQGELAVNGTLGTLGSEDTSSLDITLNQLSLPLLSPYFARYLGYTVDGGKLALDLDYRLEGTRLSGTNQIILDRLELGDSVPGERVINAPVKLGLALLRDPGGQIDLNIPLDGDLADPEFQIGRVVMGAFANLVVKAATSPFSMLGSVVDLVGLDGSELGAIGFRPGTTEFGEGEAAKLEALAEALKQRPALVLDIRGAVDPVIDRPALDRERLFEDLGIPDGASREARIDRLSSAYSQAGLEPSLSTLQARHEGDPEALHSELVIALAARRELPENALANLAQNRGERLQRALREDHGVPGDQLYLRDPIMDAELGAEGDLVRVPFELQAR